MKKKTKVKLEKGKKYALLSVFYKEGTNIKEIAERLVRMGYGIVSSGGTAKYFRENGIVVIDVADITGYPPILDHRVVTLHPQIQGGFLGMDTEEHMAEMEKYGIPRFDIVICGVYPVWEAIARPGVTVAEVMKLLDIGGPTMLRGTAKNHDNGRTVFCDIKDVDEVLNQLESSGTVNEKTRRRLAKKVFRLISRYDDSIAKFLAAQDGEKEETIFLSEGKELAYAENKNQNPAFLFRGDEEYPLSPTKMKVESGNPGYTATADTDGIIQILCRMAEAFKRWKGIIPYIVVAGKHGNPCGVGVDWFDPKKALLKALLGDTRAVMGGEVVTNFPMGAELAQELYQVNSDYSIGRARWGADVVIAPMFDVAALEILGKRKSRKILSNVNLKTNPVPYQGEWLWRFVSGDFLAQKPPSFILTPNQIAEWTNEPLEDDKFADLIIAWAVCWSASSNTVALAKDGMLIALGCGQQDRVGCVRLCLDRAAQAGHDVKGSVFASDGFFPFAEGSSEYDKIETILSGVLIKKKGQKLSSHEMLKRFDEIVTKVRRLDEREGTELLVDAGCIGGIVPADGKRLDEVKDFFSSEKLSVAFVAPENRGFSKH